MIAFSPTMSLVSAEPSDSLTPSRPIQGIEPLSAPSTPDATPSPRVLSNGNASESSDASNSEWSASDNLQAPTKCEASIGHDAFDNDRSRALFDVVDQFQSCGAGRYIDIPQLVIVGDQSTGKSSLLRSLTDIPFPVADGCCTRFATRIVSRRTAPGTPNQVKITIVPPDFKIKHFDYPPDDHYRSCHEVRDSLTAEEFSRIIEKVTTEYMGINPGTGVNNKNFAVEVLKVEILGPQRPHFSILDIPGTVNNDFNLRPGEKLGISNMVAEYMKQPQNIVICVADAIADLARQFAFELAKIHVDETRLIGVFTKCDVLKRTGAEKIVQIVNGKEERVDKLSHHGWFVVRNRADDNDPDPDFDLQQAEANLFRQEPWTNVAESRRGSTRLKMYLSELLCDKIVTAFPRLVARLGELLRDAEVSMARLGEPRKTNEMKRAYLVSLAQKYEERAKDALERPWQLERPNTRVRRLVRESNDSFAEQMRTSGHVYTFEDYDTKEEDYIRRLGELMFPDAQEAQQNTTSALSAAPASEKERPIREGEELFAKIREEINNCGCTELPGQVHPDIIPRLYREQTLNWRAIAEDHLREVAAGVMRAAEEILESVCSRSGSAGILFEEWLFVLHQSYDDALERALREFQTYCDGDQMKLLQITDPAFAKKLRILKSLRMVSTIAQAVKLAAQAKKDMHFSLEEIELTMFDACHHSTAKNTANEVHDILKVYYEFSLQSFIRHITNTIVEDFVIDPTGPLKRLSATYIYSLPPGEVDRLGQESKDVVEERLLLDRRIKTLRDARNAARTVPVKTGSSV
ncbi:P-loop containing nucleoside triphosphate hydrolase protein [Schizothecium vesticola]|uniref:P-loop containing nucleoside triphosphate hydrolase protein n=1 Tax=Schizothecium vesticola TaxID=314040 RepID=A0AA40K7M1_9PEZI|nr:P-loop containing nucleoside triphosphate hydrolase protein [Schizothecium vesticola]